jgi:hypothetical protein
MGSLAWDEVERSVKEGKKQQSQGRRLFMDDGDTAELRFIGLGGKRKEPFIYKRHFDAKTKRYLVCAEDQAKAGEHDGCVACTVAKTLRGKEARLKLPQRLYAVSVFDPRKYHFLENRAKGEQYEPCTDDDSCKYCRRNIERRINGVRHWSLAENLVLQLRTFERDTLGKKCNQCDGGRIKVVGYECPTCETEMEPDDPTEEIRCIACEKEQKKKPVLVKPKEVVSCKNCGREGKRLTLGDAWIVVSKSGKRQNTTWNFTVGEIEEFDPDAFLKEFPDLKKIKPIDFANNSEFEPVSAAEQAAILNVRNPFRKGGDDDVDDDDDDDDEDAVDRARRKKRKAAADDDDDDEPKKKKRARDDDDEDDEEDTRRSKKKKRSRDDDDDDEDEKDSIFD